MTPSRLRYWKRTELLTVRPRADASVVPADRVDLETGSLDFKALVGVRSILALIEEGVSLRRIRRSLELLRERHPDLDDPVAALRLWAPGSDRLVFRPAGPLEEPDGQMVFELDAADSPTRIDSSAEGITPISAGNELEPMDEARIARAVVEWFERGCELDTDPGTYGQAIDAYETALSLDDEFADGHCNLGAVHYNRGDRNLARTHFQRCLELDRDHVEGHFNLANLLEETGADEMALQHYQGALRADPMYPDLHINLALLHEKLGHTGPAREHWRRYLQLDSGGSWADVARQRLAKQPVGG